MAGFLAACSLTACSRGTSDAPADGPPSSNGSSRPTPGGAPSLTPWSRGAAARPPEVAGGAGPDLVTSADPTALDEILAAAPKARPGPTGEDGGTLIGTDTGETEAKGTSPSATSASAPSPGAPRISVGAISVQGEIAARSIERSARAQLYWDLVQRCRDKEGKILPPDAVTLTFRVDEDGYIVPASIAATAADAAHADAAHCMRRELSAATFRASAGARGVPANVTMTVPSVD